MVRITIFHKVALPISTKHAGRREFHFFTNFAIFMSGNFQKTYKDFIFLTNTVLTFSGNRLWDTSTFLFHGYNYHFYLKQYLIETAGFWDKIFGDTSSYICSPQLRKITAEICHPNWPVLRTKMVQNFLGELRAFRQR